MYVRVCVRERIPVRRAGIKDIDLLSYVRGECTCTYAHLSSPACAKKRGGACFCIFLIACTSGRRDVNVVRAQFVFIIFHPKEEKSYEETGVVGSAKCANRAVVSDREREIVCSWHARAKLGGAFADLVIACLSDWEKCLPCQLFWSCPLSPLSPSVLRLLRLQKPKSQSLILRLGSFSTCPWLRGVTRMCSGEFY